MFETALFIIVQKWKQFKRPSMNGWMNKMWYTNTLEYYSSIKRNQVLTRANMEELVSQAPLSMGFSR